jgi:prepilin-type processing-associated H-X9-DG protein
MSNEGKRQTFPWLALVGVAAIVLVVVSILLPALSRPTSGRRPADQNYLKQLGLVCKMYANENADLFPPITPYPDVWMFDLQSIYPEYLSDLSILVSPNHPNAEALQKQISALSTQQPTDWEALTRLAAQSYAYTGWATEDNVELAQLIEARRALGSEQLSDDIVVEGKTFYRLKEGIEPHFIRDTTNATASAEAQAKIPVVISITPPPKAADGSNVLYMDGHVTWIKDIPAALF